MTETNKNPLVLVVEDYQDAREMYAAYLQFWNERARRGHALDAIRGHLEEQPSPGAARARARRWCNDITNLAEVVIKAMNNTERPE